MNDWRTWCKVCNKAIGAAGCITCWWNEADTVELDTIDLVPYLVVDIDNPDADDIENATTQPYIEKERVT